MNSDPGEEDDKHVVGSENWLTFGQGVEDSFCVLEAESRIANV